MNATGNLHIWIFVYTCEPKKHFNTTFEASDREIAELHVNILFRMLAGMHYNPETLRSEWVSDESLKGKNVFLGSTLNKEGEKRTILAGVLYDAAELKKEIESQPNDTDKKLLDKLKHSDISPI